MVAKRKRYGAEEIIGNLREAEVSLAQGQPVAQVVRKLGVSEQTYYRWRREYGGIDLPPVFIPLAELAFRPRPPRRSAPRTRCARSSDTRRRAVRSRARVARRSSHSGGCAHSGHRQRDRGLRPTP